MEERLKKMIIGLKKDKCNIRNQIDLFTESERKFNELGCLLFGEQKGKFNLLCNIINNLEIILEYENAK